MIEQQDPCQEKHGVTGDVTYCDRYWECAGGVPELYDCPNGLVFVGKNRGIADGCDYPWRNPSLCTNKDLASKTFSRREREGTQKREIGGKDNTTHTHNRKKWW